MYGAVAEPFPLLGKDFKNNYIYCTKMGIYYLQYVNLRKPTLQII